MASARAKGKTGVILRVELRSSTVNNTQVSC